MNYISRKAACALVGVCVLTGGNVQATETVGWASQVRSTVTAVASKAWQKIQSGYEAVRPYGEQVVGYVATSKAASMVLSHPVATAGIMATVFGGGLMALAYRHGWLKKLGLWTKTAKQETAVVEKPDNTPKRTVETKPKRMSEHERMKREMARFVAAEAAKQNA